MLIYQEFFGFVFGFASRNTGKVPSAIQFSRLTRCFSVCHGNVKYKFASTILLSSVFIYCSIVLGIPIHLSKISQLLAISLITEFSTYRHYAIPYLHRLGRFGCCCHGAPAHRYAHEKTGLLRRVGLRYL
jgi:hypothetical protein